MFNKKVTEASPLYVIIYLPSDHKAAAFHMNEQAGLGYRFLDWFDDKWERNGYSDTGGQRRAILIKQ